MEMTVHRWLSYIYSLGYDVMYLVVWPVIIAVVVYVTAKMVNWRWEQHLEAHLDYESKKLIAEKDAHIAELSEKIAALQRRMNSYVAAVRGAEIHIGHARESMRIEAIESMRKSEGRGRKQTYATE